MSVIISSIVLLYCSYSISALQITPSPNTDYLFVVQKPIGIGEANFQKVRDFLEEFVSINREEVEADDWSTVRFAAIHYDVTARIDFSFKDGFTLKNVARLYAATNAIVYDPAVGSNLPGAVELAVRVLSEESERARNQVVIFLTDGVVDRNQDTFNSGVAQLHSNYVSVFVICVLEDSAKRSRLETPNRKNIEKLADEDANKIFIEQEYSHLRIDLPEIMQVVWTYTYRKECTCSVLACSRTCGVGTRQVTCRCEIFVNLILHSSWHLKYDGPCCVQPCLHGSGVSPTWFCRYLPPANGLP